MKNPLLSMVEKRKAGIHCGIPSFCCANKLVIEAILDQAKRFDDTVVIEATSNQVNQNYGYTGMTPKDFQDFVYQIADKIDFEREKIILGGDHMGPLPWVDLPAEEAMANAEVLVRLCVHAGYTKIHLDTSMRLGDDPTDVMLPDSVIAERGARLYKACEEEFALYLQENPDAVHPVYVIGSEVPIPGGAQDEEEGMILTTPDRFEQTLLTYHQKFAELGLVDAWQHIIAMVVQPGVEFGNREIRRYNRMDAYSLCQELKKYPDIVFEGHSTDYQSPQQLREMVEDGIAIIKVGPALTFAMREALFALSHMEDELVPKEDRANFINVLEDEMLKNPKHWKKYYFGSDEDRALDRKYSFSDRCRYYMAIDRIEETVDKLFSNMAEVEIPMGMLHQYMPLQYIKVRDGKLKKEPKELVKDSVVSLVEDYNYAVKYNYVTGGIFVR